MSRAVMVCVMIAMLSWPALAQSEKTNPALMDYQTRLETVQAETQSQLDALATQASDPNPQIREEAGRMVNEIKRQGEIRRLEILLEKAQSENDQARIAEITVALDHWRNPPQTRILPQVSRDETPGTNVTTERTNP